MKDQDLKKMSRREFLKKNLLAGFALFSGALISRWLPFLKGRQNHPGTSMHPARHYKELAG